VVGDDVRGHELDLHAGVPEARGGGQGGPWLPPPWRAPGVQNALLGH